MCKIEVNTAHVNLREYMELVRFKEEQVEKGMIVIECHSSSRFSEQKTTVYYTIDEVVKSLTNDLNNSLSIIEELRGEIRINEINLHDLRSNEKYCFEVETLSFWEFVCIKWRAFKNRF